MKRLGAALLLFILIFAGCAASDSEITPALSLRSKLMNGQGCSFDAIITADYGDSIQIFGMNCSTDRQGNLSFTVTQPQTIAGITGKISATEGALTFDDHVLVFSVLADGQISPVNAPWVFVNTLRGGYIKTCSKWEKGTKVTIDDSYQENALQLDIWLNDTNTPVRSEILYQGRRILSMDVKNFRIV